MRSAAGSASRTRKALSFYRVNFGHKPPYEVLCDGPTIFQSLKNDMYLKQALPRLLGGIAYPVVTECVVKELRGLGEEFSSAALFAKRVKRVPCVHEGKVSVAECLAFRIKEPYDTKLILASNDPDVVFKAARIPGIPIVSILNQTKFMLKAPSQATLNSVKNAQKTKTQNISDPDKALLEQVRAAEKEIREKRLLRKKRKRAKGPNPLSIKKPKVARGSSTDNNPDLPSTRAGDLKTKGGIPARNDSSVTPDQSKGTAKNENDENAEMTKPGLVSTLEQTSRRRKKRPNLLNELDGNGFMTTSKAANIQGNTNNVSTGLPSDTFANAGQRKLGGDKRSVASKLKSGRTENNESCLLGGIFGGEVKLPMMDPRKPSPRTESPRNPGKVSEKEETKPSPSGARKHDRKQDDSHDAGIEHKNTTSGDDDQPREPGEIQTGRECDGNKDALVSDGKRRKKHRKNRRRRPKKGTSPLVSSVSPLGAETNL